MLTLQACLRRHAEWDAMKKLKRAKQNLRMEDDDTVQRKIVRYQKRLDELSSPIRGQETKLEHEQKEPNSSKNEPNSKGNKPNSMEEEPDNNGSSENQSEGQGGIQARTVSEKKSGVGSRPQENAEKEREGEQKRFQSNKTIGRLSNEVSQSSLQKRGSAKVLETGGERPPSSKTRPSTSAQFSASKMDKSAGEQNGTGRQPASIQGPSLTTVAEVTTHVGKRTSKVAEEEDPESEVSLASIQKEEGGRQKQVEENKTTMSRSFAAPDR